MLDGGIATAAVLLLAIAAALFGWLALLAGHLLRTEGVREIRALLELQHSLTKARVRTAVDMFGGAETGAPAVNDERAVAALIRKALKSS
jgi:hypothetical protein